MLFFLIPGWSDSERPLVVRSLVELGARMGTRFTIVASGAELPAEARVVSYSRDGNGPNALPCAWDAAAGATRRDGRTLWGAADDAGRMDVVAGTAQLLSMRHEADLPSGAFDSLGRIRPAEHPLNKAGVLATPLVEHAASHLSATLSAAGLAVPRDLPGPWPGGRKRALVLTHDVDGPRLQSLSSLARYLFYGFVLGARDGRQSFTHGLMTRLAGRPDPQWGFAHWPTLEAAYGLRSTWFVYPGKAGGPRDWRDPGYRAGEPEIARELRVLAEYGHEIAVHNGIRATSMEDLQRSRLAVEAATGGARVSGLRPHYWGRDWSATSETWRKVEAAGYTYDAGANPGTLGFRFGTGLPFMPNFSDSMSRGLVVVPTGIMDSYAVARTAGRPAPDIAADLEAITVPACDYGLIVLDWHERVISNVGVWRGLMRPLLELLNRLASDSDVCTLTAGEAASSWREHVARCYRPAEDLGAR
jgi:hypothetical protein